MYKRVFLGLLIAIAATESGMVAGDETPADASTTAKWMVEQERAWAEQSCGKRWVLSDLLAADFRGTAPKGTRYDKPTAAPEPDPTAAWHTDCRLLDADVRFFGADVAVVYGSESSVAPLADSSHERRCLVWTDTWLKRNGRWQIVAAQDTRVDCPST